MSLAIISEVAFANNFIVKDNTGKFAKGVVLYLQPQFNIDVSAHHFKY